MKIVVDLTYLKKIKLSVNEYLSLLTLANSEITYQINKSDYLSLQDKGLIQLNGNNVSILEKGIKIIEGKAESRQYEDLAEQLRVIYPIGKKGGKWPWRGYSRDIVDRLKKLDKNFDLRKYSDEQIIAAVKDYVSKFNARDMDMGMQLLQYFIEKEGNSALIAWLESDDKPEIKASIIDIRL